MIRIAAAPVALALTGSLLLSGCHGGERKAKADTGTAEATVETKAPVSAVSNSDLQQQAQSAADAASTPVADTTGTATPAGATSSTTTTTTTTTGNAH